MSWNTILVPYDFSASAEHAATIARDEAKAHGAQVVVLHVVELMPHFGHESTLMARPGTGAPISVRRYFEQAAEADLAPVVARLTDAGVLARAAVRSGVPTDEIITFLGDHPVDLIVMGTHGRTGLRRVIIGSVAERVIRASAVPVLTIRDPE